MADLSLVYRSELGPIPAGFTLSSDQRTMFAPYADKWTPSQWAFMARWATVVLPAGNVVRDGITRLAARVAAGETLTLADVNSTLGAAWTSPSSVTSTIVGTFEGGTVDAPEGEFTPYVPPAPSTSGSGTPDDWEVTVGSTAKSDTPVLSGVELSLTTLAPDAASSSPASLATKEQTLGISSKAGAPVGASKATAAATEQPGLFGLEVSGMVVLVVALLVGTALYLATRK